MLAALLRQFVVTFQYLCLCQFLIAEQTYMAYVWVLSQSVGTLPFA
jgi:hypothetical protein